MSNKRHISTEEWLQEGERLFGADKSKWQFVCPNCGNIQTGNDFRKIHVDPTGKVFYSCIGRFMNSDEVGTIGDKKSPCNYTSGGLFVFSSTFVDDTPVFEFFTGTRTEQP